MRRYLTLIALFSILFFPSTSSGQYIYFSPTGGCAVDGTDCWYFINTYFVFIDTPGINDAIGASFRLESDVYGPEDFSAVISHENIFVQSGDLFSGITLSWPPGLYSVDTLMTISIELNEPHNSSWTVCVTRDIKIFKANGDTINLSDFPFECSHCYQSSVWVRWDHPDTMLAIIGEQTLLEIISTGYSTGGIAVGDFNISDEQGWIPSGTDCLVYCKCPPCPWDIQHIGLDVTIPSDVLVGTLSKVRIEPLGLCCMRDSSFFYIKATSKVPVENSSWGSIKSLFGGD